MRTRITGLVVLGLVGAIGCGAEGSGSVGVTPEVDLDHLDPAWAQSASAGGWTTAVSSAYHVNTPSSGVTQLLGWNTFTGGTGTRGGGVCIVGQSWQDEVSCTTGNDSPCINQAQSIFGASAYGYCVPYYNGSSTGSCWLRATDNCKRNPFWTSGSQPMAVAYSTDDGGYGFTQWGVLGCMTTDPNYPFECGMTTSTKRVHVFTTIDY